MLKPVESLETWSERHGIKPIQRKCKGCGKLLTTTEPVATKKCRGLKSEPHECGPEYDLIALKPIDKDFLNLILKF